VKNRRTAHGVRRTGTAKIKKGAKCSGRAGQDLETCLALYKVKGMAHAVPQSPQGFETVALPCCPPAYAVKPAPLVFPLPPDFGSLQSSSLSYSSSNCRRVSISTGSRCLSFGSVEPLLSWISVLRSKTLRVYPLNSISTVWSRRSP
jgi:hypothetical protein